MFQTNKDFITCSKLIINELGGFPIRSDNVCFANNEQGSLVFFIAHGEHNLINLNLYNNQWSFGNLGIDIGIDIGIGVGIRIQM